MPEILPGSFIPGPVGFFGIQEDDPRLGVFLVRIAPHIIIAIWRIRIGARRLEPGVLVGGVVQHQVDDHAHAALVRLVQQVSRSSSVPYSGRTL